MVDLPLTGAQAELEGEFGKKAGKEGRGLGEERIILPSTCKISIVFMFS